MKSKLLKPRGEKTWALVFDTDDEVLAELLRSAQENRLGGAHFTAIGGFR